MIHWRWQSHTSIVWLITVILRAAAQNMGHPTPVPGSEHLVVQKDFPYEFWSAGNGQVTPTRPPTTRRHSSYQHYYGEARVANANQDQWHILPIQLPDDLVGNVSQQVVPTTTQVPIYPTSVTPQYGRHPGATEAHHLFHPERLYNHHNDHGLKQQRITYTDPRHPDEWTDYPSNPSDHNFNNDGNIRRSDSAYDPQISRPPLSTNSNRRPESLPWHQSLMEKMEPLIGSARLPSLPKLRVRFPGFNSIPNLPKLPVWPFNMLHDTTARIDHEYQGHDTATTDESQVLHQFYPIISEGQQPHFVHHRNRRPFYVKTSQSQGHQHGDIDRHSRFSEDESSYLSYEPLNLHQSPSVNSYNHQTPERTGQIYDHSSHTNFDINTMLGKPTTTTGNRNRYTRKYKSPLRRFYNIWNSESEEGERQPSRPHHPWGNSRPSVQNWGNRYETQDKIQYQERPQSTWDSNLAPGHQSDRPTYSSYNDNHHHHNTHHHQHESENMWQEDYHKVPSFGEGIIERLTGVEGAATVVPGGLLAVGVALAVFYFNFIWYPTPVVTAKLGKILPDSEPSSFKERQQTAVNEVYEVFRSLEDMIGPDGWPPSCKARFVCQVHRELPGLWQVTQEFSGLIKSYVSMEAEEGNVVAVRPEEDSEVDTYLAAGERGAKGSCREYYPDCQLPNSSFVSLLHSIASLANLHT